MVWAVVLAAGESRRMGEPKLLLPFGEKTMIESILDNLLRSKAGKILVVVGSHRKEILKKIGDRPVETAINRRYREGMLSSIQAGFKTLPRDIPAALVCLGDQPFIPFSVSNALIEAYEGTQKGIILPVYKRRRGHPILIDTKYRQEIMDLSPETGLKTLVHNHPEDILEIAVEAPQILKDIDYPEDYESQLANKEEK